MNNTYRVNIYIAGNYDDARRVCQEYCSGGFCVTVSKTKYVYKGGIEGE